VALLVVAVPVVEGAPAARHGVQLVTPAGAALRGSWQSWADAALVPTVTGQVTVRLTGCPGYPRSAGCVFTGAPRVIYLKRKLDHPRSTLLHELGHVYDLTVLNNSDRGRFRRIMRSHAKWWTSRPPLAERFAEGYSWCARYARIASIRRYALYGYHPTAKQHRRVCALITRAARDRTPPAPPAESPKVTGDPPSPAPPPVAPGVVPGDSTRDPGPAPPESPTATPTPTPTRTATPTPTPTRTPRPPLLPPLPIPTIIPLPPILFPTATPAQ
jgi:hypothetical protein